MARFALAHPDVAFSRNCGIHLGFAAYWLSGLGSEWIDHPKDIDERLRFRGNNEVER